MKTKNVLIGAGLFVAGMIVGYDRYSTKVAKALANGIVINNDSYESRTAFNGKYALTLMTFKDKVVTTNIDEEEVES